MSGSAPGSARGQQGKCGGGGDGRGEMWSLWPRPSSHPRPHGEPEAKAEVEPFPLHNYLVDLSQYYRYSASFTTVAPSGDDHSATAVSSSSPHVEPIEDGPQAQWLKSAPLLSVHHINSASTATPVANEPGGCGGRFRKSWGNFINIYDEQGRQQQVIHLSQLTNYMHLQRYGQQASLHELRLYASLFTGNYPRPLYSGSGANWRMRFNLFASGVPLLARQGLAHTPAPADTLIHLGELHLYLHVARGQCEPRYQNLCYFYDRNLVSLVARGEVTRGQMAQVALALKAELARPSFVEQFFLPLDPSRFRATDQTVEYLVLRQQDLKAAMQVINEVIPFAFLHRPQHLFT